MVFQRVLFILLVLSLSGCATIARDTSDESEVSPTIATPTEPLHLYYDFQDIPIPREMEIDTKESIFFESPQIKTGVLLFEGRVDPVSLFDFYVNNMPKDNWKLRSYFKYNRYILIFEKDNKDCVITIYDKSFSTTMQIWVAPRFHAGESLNPPLDEAF